MRVGACALEAVMVKPRKLVCVCVCVCVCARGPGGDTGTDSAGRGRHTPSWSRTFQP